MTTPSTTPTTGPLDTNTIAILELTADLPHPSVKHEWLLFLKAIHIAHDKDTMLLNPNVLRTYTRGHIAPKRIGALTRAACTKGILTDKTGPNEELTWTVSTDTEGRNGGKPARYYKVTNLEKLLDTILENRPPHNTTTRPITGLIKNATRKVEAA